MPMHQMGAIPSQEVQDLLSQAMALAAGNEELLGVLSQLEAALVPAAPRSAEEEMAFPGMSLPGMPEGGMPPGML